MTSYAHCDMCAYTHNNSKQTDVLNHIYSTREVRACTLQAEAPTTAPPNPHPFLIGGTSEHEKLCRARDQCREILKFVNEAVKQTENRHRLESYQKRLDATALERASNPLAAEFKVGGEGSNTGSPSHILRGAL